MSPRLPALLGCLLAALAPAALRADDAPAAPAEDAARKIVYTLNPQDKVRVDIYQEDLTTETRVDALGNINLALVGELHLAGLTIPQAQKAIEAAYRDGRYLAHPQVTVTIEEYAPREVSIQGMVKNPGRYLLPPESSFTVVDLVTKAGGFTDIAQGSSVRVTHTDPDGKKTTTTVDVSAFIQGKKSAKAADALMLQPGDVVYVPEKLI